MIVGLSHIAVRTHDLALTLAFYTRALGLTEISRPASMTFPGAWIALPGQKDEALVHVYAGEAAGAAASGPSDAELGSVDHLALEARGFADYRRRFGRLGMNWREQHRPGRTVWQMFLHDPNGTKIELSFSTENETDLPSNVDASRPYAPDERFFSAADFGGLLKGDT